MNVMLLKELLRWRGELKIARLQLDQVLLTDPNPIKVKYWELIISEVLQKIEEIENAKDAS